MALLLEHPSASGKSWSPATIAGRLLIALRSVAMQSDNNALKTVGGRFFVPVPFLPG